MHARHSRRPRAHARAAEALPGARRNETGTDLASLEPRRLLGGDPFPDLGLLDDPINPVIRMQTDRGSIFIELLQNEAPNTVAAFLERIEGPFSLSHTFFHNVQPGVALEGGTWFFIEDLTPDGLHDTANLNSNAVRTDDPAEGGRANTERTIASRWIEPSPGAGHPVHMIFNLADNTAAHPANEYVVFARVLDDASWAVVQEIASLPVGSFAAAPNLLPYAQDLTSVPFDESYTPGEPINPSVVVQSADMAVIRQGGAPDFYRHTIYSAEGFTGGTISEFIPIVNPNDAEVFYEVRVRYERSTDNVNGYVRDDLAFRGSIAPNSRGGVTICTPETWTMAPVFPNRPYAIEIWSTLPVAANFSHYDFGIATGEAFAATLGTSWFFGDVEKDNDGHDFILWYNPGAVSGTVTLTFRTDTGALAPITFGIEAFRRGGINIRETAAIPNGRYTVILESTIPVLASESHYGVTALGPPIDGWGTPGQAGAPSTIGVVPIVYERGGDNPAGQPDIGFVFYNPGAEPTDVSIDFYESGSATPAMTLTNVATLAAGERRRVVLHSGTLPIAASLTAVIRSTEPVFASAWYLRIEDSYSAGVAVSAGTRFHFAEGFTDPARTFPNTLEESMTLFNPFGTAFGAAPQDASVTLTFRYSDGAMFSISRTVNAGAGLNLHISSLQEVIDQAEQHDRFFYSIEVASDVPIIAQFMHTDRTLAHEFAAGGGFSSFGTPFGALVRVDEIGG